MRYTIFEFALMAFVTFTVFESNESASAIDGSDCPCEINVRGAISTSMQVRDGKEISHMLFDKEYENICLVVGVPSELPAMAVPTYSVLRIKLRLEVDSEQIVSDGLEFEPKHVFPMAVMKDVVGKRWHVQIAVTWRHAYDYLEEDEIPELDINKLYSNRFSRRGIEEESSFEVLLGMTLKCPVHQRVPLESDVRSSIQRGIVLFPSYKSGLELVEVFSIFVGSKVGRARRTCEDLHGTIRCYNSDKEYLIKGEEIVKRNHKCLPLFKPPHFGMLFDLEDDKGTKISKGGVCWNGQIASRWLDRRLFSVVLGKEGFGVAHYIIYSSAIVAKLNVILRLSYNVRDVLTVQGKICATCSTYKYSNLYEKNYYQSILFDNGRGDGVEIGGDNRIIEVPLSKDVVAVPLNASLIVALDLCALAASGESHELKGEVDLNHKKSMRVTETTAVESPNYYCLSVRVEWS